MGLKVDTSGGQFSAAIKQIVEAEKQPIKQMEARKAKEEAKVKLFQEFKGKFTGFDAKLGEFSNPANFKEYKVDLGEGANLVGVTIDKTKVVPGKWDMEIMSLANRSSIISNGFDDPDAAILGSGYVTVRNADGDKEEIYVGGKQASLRGVASAINARADSSISATVVKDSADPDAPWRLIVNAKKDGLASEVHFPEFYFMDGKKDLYIDDSMDASNAVVKVNGFEIELDGNKVPDFLQGVNLDLKQAKEGQTFSVQVSEDVPKMSEKIKSLVDQINGVLEFINKQNTVDDKTDTSTTFAGDTSLQAVEYRLRNIMHEGFPVWDNKDDPETPRLVFMSTLGVEIGKDGKFTFSADKFNKNAEKDTRGIVEAVSGEYGFANQLRQVMANYTRPGSGLLSTREQGLRNRIQKIDRDIEYKQRLVDRKQEMLVQQFSRLQATMQNMQAQQQYMSATLGGGGGQNPILQLMGG